MEAEAVPDTTGSVPRVLAWEAMSGLQYPPATGYAGDPGTSHEDVMSSSMGPLVDGGYATPSRFRPSDPLLPVGPVQPATTTSPKLGSMAPARTGKWNYHNEYDLTSDMAVLLGAGRVVDSAAAY